MLKNLKAQPLLYSVVCGMIAFFVTVLILLTTVVPIYVYFHFKAPALPSSPMIAETERPIGNKFLTVKERHNLTFHFVGDEEHGEVLIKDTNLSNNITEQTYLSLIPNAKYKSWTILDPYTGIGFASLVENDGDWSIYFPEGELKMYPITKDNTEIVRQDLSIALPDNEQIWV